MDTFARTCDSVAATSKKNEKVAIVAGFLQQHPSEAAIAAQYFAGHVFPAWEERTLQVGGSLLWRVIVTVSDKPDIVLTAAYRKYGDLGSASQDVLTGVAPEQSGYSLGDLPDRFSAIAAARDVMTRMSLLRGLLAESSAIAAKYLVKLMTGDMRIGLKESLVEEAISRAYDAKAAEVQRANMLLGDIAETLRLASQHRLGEARMRLFHPIGFMLASPVESSDEAFDFFHNARVEDKYDGIRAQAHVSGGQVKIFSRTRDDITESFPELAPWLAALPEDAILDGEILAWDLAEERALPFSALQKRLGRKRVTRAIERDVPVAYVAFDCLYAGGELLLDCTLRERSVVLDRLLRHRLSPTAARDGQHELFPSRDETETLRVLRAPAWHAESPEDLDALFQAAQDRGNEGLMIKDEQSRYLPGRRGKWWLKLKRELATLDVVVTAVEYGHGKRANVLSDYTFAVSDGERLRNVGKAYTGLTDVEIAEMTRWFLAHTLHEDGWVRQVEPKVVVEVAFNAVMRSDRHDSGFALRFPRIVRLRPDKTPEAIDTIDTVREIYDRQHKPRLRAS